MQALQFAIKSKENQTTIHQSLFNCSHTLTSGNTHAGFWWQFSSVVQRYYARQIRSGVSSAGRNIDLYSCGCLVDWWNRHLVFSEPLFVSQQNPQRIGSIKRPCNIYFMEGTMSVTLIIDGSRFYVSA